MTLLPNGARGPASTPARKRPEEPLGARVALADRAALVHHENAVPHVADHEPVHLLHVGQVEPALRRELLARHRITRQRVGQPGNREVRRR